MSITQKASLVQEEGILTRTIGEEGSKRLKEVAREQSMLSESALLVQGEGKGEVPLTDPRPVALKFVRARQLRRDQTDAELVLWRHLRARRLNGLRFRRQFPLGPFITDFCCRERHLVIELDGGQHNERTGAARDKFRTGLIEKRGYRILRFWDNEVLTNINGVCR